MKPWLRFSVLLLCLMAAQFLGMENASASSLTSAETTCTSTMNTDTSATQPYFITPLINCFVNPTNGFIPLITTMFLSQTMSYFYPMMAAMFTVAIAFFGFKMAMGNLQRPNSEIFTLLFKAGGVYYFYANASSIYTTLLGILQALSDAISSAALPASSTITLPGGAFTCSASMSPGATGGAAALWARWDCILDLIFGWSGQALVVGGLALYLLEMLFTGGYAGLPSDTSTTNLGAGSTIIVFIVGLYVLMGIFFAAMRFVHIYLMAILAMSFVFCFGYLFVPLIFFKNAIDYFKQWLAMVMSYIISPMILMAFMGIMLVALDTSLFSGPYSLWREAAGPGAGANAFYT